MLIECKYKCLSQAGKEVGWIMTKQVIVLGSDYPAIFEGDIYEMCIMFISYSMWVLNESITRPSARQESVN